MENILDELAKDIATKRAMHLRATLNSLATSTTQKKFRDLMDADGYEIPAFLRKGGNQIELFAKSVVF